MLVGVTATALLSETTWRTSPTGIGHVHRRRDPLPAVPPARARLERKAARAQPGMRDGRGVCQAGAKAACRFTGRRRAPPPEPAAGGVPRSGAIVTQVRGFPTTHLRLGGVSDSSRTLPRHDFNTMALPLEPSRLKGDMGSVVGMVRERGFGPALGDRRRASSPCGLLSAAESGRADDRHVETPAARTAGSSWMTSSMRRTAARGVHPCL